MSSPVYKLKQKMNTDKEFNEKFNKDMKKKVTKTETTHD